VKMDDSKILKKLFEHDQRFEDVDVKLTNFRDEMLTGMDKIMVILQRLDQERIFTNEAIRRLEKGQERQQKEIDHIKQVLNIA